MQSPKCQTSMRSTQSRSQDKPACFRCQHWRKNLLSTEEAGGGVCQKVNQFSGNRPGSASVQSEDGDHAALYTTRDFSCCLFEKIIKHETITVKKKGKKK